MKKRSFLVETNKCENKIFHVLLSYLIIANLKKTSILQTKKNKGEFGTKKHYSILLSQSERLILQIAISIINKKLLFTDGYRNLIRLRNF